jgi:hypothetical protein
MIPFFGVWYYGLLRSGAIDNPIIWLFLLFPIAFLPILYKSLKIVVMGEQLSFDGVMRTILKNQKLLARFDEVEHLQIRTISGEGEEHRLTAVLGSGKKIGIHTSGDSDEIIALADDVADIVKVKVIRKN